jgi:hypothetical protein
MEATRAMAVHAMAAFSQKAVAVWKRATIYIKEVEVWATLVERVAQEMVSKVEAKSATSLASACKEVEGSLGGFPFWRASSRMHARLET